MKFPALLLSLALSFGLVGCARMTQRLSTVLEHPDGTVETRTTRTSGWACWDAKQTLDKLKVSNGKTHAVGLAGAEQESNSTNAAATLDALTRLLGQLR